MTRFLWFAAAEKALVVVVLAVQLEKVEGGLASGSGAVPLEGV